MTGASAPRYFLRTARLGFRCWHRTDLDLALALWGDPRVTRLFDSRGALNRSQVRERLEAELAHQEEHGYQYWPVFRVVDDAHVGCCGLRPHDPQRLRLELGVHLRPEFWGKGLGREACEAAVKHAFQVVGARSLFAGHHPDNHESRRLLMKLGFSYTHDEHFAATGREHLSYELRRR